MKEKSACHSAESAYQITRTEHNQRLPVNNVCIIGAGYVGGLSATVLACKNPETRFHVVDIDEERIAAWNSEAPPFNEPGLKSMHRAKHDEMAEYPANLCFSTEVDRAIDQADVVFIAVNTPLMDSGHSAQKVLELCHVDACVERIAQVATSSKIIVQKSTVPCGTAKRIGGILGKLASPGVSFTVLSNPEFLAEGTAIFNLLHPDRVVIGSDQDHVSMQAAKVLGSIYESWVSPNRILYVNTKSAELIKLTANALLAQRITSINAISSICEETGADIDEVAVACGLDARIGPYMLQASLGFGGSCLKKDVLTLAHFSDNLGLEQIGSYWRSINDVNEFQKSRFTQRILKVMDNTLSQKKIAIIGCAFKKGTGDVRESPGVSLIADILSEKAHVSVYDPNVQQSQLIAELSKRLTVSGSSGAWKQRIEFQSSISDACRHVHAIVIATDLEELTAPVITLSGSEEVAVSIIDWKGIVLQMQHPKLLFDGRNVVDINELTKLGLQIHMIGRAPSN